MGTRCRLALQIHCGCRSIIHPFSAQDDTFTTFNFVPASRPSRAAMPGAPKPNRTHLGMSATPTGNATFRRTLALATFDDMDTADIPLRRRLEQEWSKDKRPPNCTDALLSRSDLRLIHMYYLSAKNDADFADAALTSCNFRDPATTPRSQPQVTFKSALFLASI